MNHSVLVKSRNRILNSYRNETIPIVISKFYIRYIKHKKTSKKNLWGTPSFTAAKKTIGFQAVWAVSNYCEAGTPWYEAVKERPSTAGWSPQNCGEKVRESYPKWPKHSGLGIKEVVCTETFPSLGKTLLGRQ